MTLFAEGHHDRKAAMLGLYAQLKNTEFQISTLRRELDRAEALTKELIAVLIECDRELEQFK